MKSSTKLLSYILMTSALSMLSHSYIIAQNSGVGTAKPTHTFHVKPLESNPVKDPVRIENLQPYLSQSDSMVVVVDPAVGVLRLIHINDFGSIISDSYQDASEVDLVDISDIDGDGTPEVNVQEAVNAIMNNLPKGIFKTIGDARAAGLIDGDSFIAHPDGVLGCAGCTIKLYPGMN